MSVAGLLRAAVAAHVPQCHIDKWYNGSIHGCVFEPASIVYGDQLLGAFGGGILLFSFYTVGNGRLAAPSVALILGASVIVPMLPGNLVGYAQGIVIVGFVSAILAIARKYVLSPGI